MSRWLGFAALALLLAGAGGAAGFWVLLNVQARLELSDQPMLVRLPPELNAVAATHGELDVLMRGDIHARVPLRQTLRLPLKGTLAADIRLDAPVELDSVIHYEGVVPIDTHADIEADVSLNYQNVKQYRNLRLKARLPMQLRVPLQLDVPLKETVRIRYAGPLEFSVDHVLRAPVDTELRTTLAVDQGFRLPVTSSFRLRAEAPRAPVRASIAYSDLLLRLDTLRLERKPEGLRKDQ